MYRRCLLAAVSALLLFSCASEKSTTKPLQITADKASAYTIVVSDKADEDIQYAARLLQDGIEKMSGCRLEIVSQGKDSSKPKKALYVGPSYANTYVCDSVQTANIHRNGDNLVFSCRDSKYTIYSVVEFLRQLGMQKYAVDCVKYPVYDTLCFSIDKDWYYTPENSFRQVAGRLTNSSLDMKYWQRGHVTDDMFGRGYYVHTAKKLCDDEEYFASHPEYYAMHNGMRVRDQLCWSNDTVYEIVKKNLRKAMSFQPEAKVWSVSQNDNDTYCECDRCKALIDREGSAGAPIIAFVNRLAADFPDKVISTLAYTYSRKAPKTLPVRDNVQIVLCSIEADRNRPIEQQTGKNSFTNDIQEWGRKTKNIYLWDYEVDFAYSVSPFPNLHTLKPNLEFFENNNAFQHFQQANSDHGHEFAELKTFVISNLLWNTSLSTDSLVHEFTKNYYGERSGEMIETYIRAMEEDAIRSADSVKLDIYGAPARYADNIFSEKKMNTYDALFDLAEQFAEDSVHLLRVRTARLPLDYAIMELAKSDMYSERGWFKTVDGRFVLRNDMKERLERFYNTCKESGVETLNERGLKPSEYYSSTMRSISNDVSKELSFRKKITSEPKPNEMYGKGDINVLVNGVKGSDDYKMHWIGWWGEDFVINLDMEQEYQDRDITIGSLQSVASWILHPLSVKCLVSKDSKTWTDLGTIKGNGNEKGLDVIQEYSFHSDNAFRYVRFEVEGTKTLPVWHYGYTKKSWVFMDEIVVK